MSSCMWIYLNICITSTAKYRNVCCFLLGFQCLIWFWCVWGMNKNNEGIFRVRRIQGCAKMQQPYNSFIYEMDCRVLVYYQLTIVSLIELDDELVLCFSPNHFLDQILPFHWGFKWFNLDCTLDTWLQS